MKKIAVVNYEQLLRGKIYFFKFFLLHCRVRTKKLLDKKVNLFFKNLGSIFFGLKSFFLGLAASFSLLD